MRVIVRRSSSKFRVTTRRSSRTMQVHRLRRSQDVVIITIGRSSNYSKGISSKVGTSYGGFNIQLIIDFDSSSVVIITSGGVPYHSKGDFHTVEHRTVDTYTVDHHTADIHTVEHPIMWSSVVIITIGRSSVIIRRRIVVIHVEHRTAESRSHNYHREEFRNYSKEDFVIHRTVDPILLIINHRIITIGRSSVIIRREDILWNIIRWSSVVIITIGRSSVIIRRGISILWNIVRWIHIKLIIKGGYPYCGTSYGGVP